MVAQWISEVFKISIKRSCRLLILHRSAFYYNSNERIYQRREWLRTKVKEIALNRPRFGYRRITVLMKRDGIKVSKNTVWSIYREESLGIKKLTRQAAKRASRMRIVPSPATAPNERWSIDFIYDHLTSGFRIRGLSVIDQFSRKCLGVDFCKSYNGLQVTEALDSIAVRIGQYPKIITLDNGPEFTGLVFDEWARKHGVHLDFTRPGKPTDNGLVESFHARLRDECLSVNRFDTLAEAQNITQRWIDDYNNFRPHSSLKDRVPNDLWSHFQGELDKMMQMG